jgi:hypothetical protein
MTDADYDKHRVYQPIPKKPLGDPINPKHYRSHPSGVECIEITRHYSSNIGNVIKYVWRSGLKGENTQVEDLKKAKWYLEDEIARLGMK